MTTFFQTVPGALILLVVGFVFLIKGADFFVEGASAVAKKLHVPALVIGMTIVAMGTSLPELSVSVTASLAGSNQLAIGNVVGSNIFNLMVVLGSCALFSALEVSDDTIKKDLPFSIICTVALMVMG
ncbi:MAG: sodium:calcium antiporter, partial [Pseudobutyrivibrio sp.]|nr:sodium:calcium antiporter [Pseudobutyrivibrio sp.]